MANVRPTPSGKFELCISHKLLPKRVFLTFDTPESAHAYGDQAMELMNQGLLPTGLLPAKASAIGLGQILREWINTGQPAVTDVEVLELLVREVGKIRIDQFTYNWCEAWVGDMKLKQNLAPGTIRKRLGALSRAIDWYMRKFPDQVTGNPLKLLPRGASIYTEMDAKAAQALGKVAKVDVARDRRITPAEIEAIMQALAGVKREDRQRALDLREGPEFKMLFLLILRTGARMREAYTMRTDQVDLKMRNIRVRCSKQWRGKVVWRNVPISPTLHAELTEYLASHTDELMFPWAKGVEGGGLDTVSTKLSSRFSTLFAYAGVTDVTEHDLRHHATCTWFEMRRPDGNWVFREAEVEKIMGWAPGSKMAQRYASFRAEDLAARMW